MEKSEAANGGKRSPELWLGELKFFYPEAVAALFAAGLGQRHLKRASKAAVSLRPEEFSGARPKASHEDGGGNKRQDDASAGLRMVNRQPR
jgi:hypothetical protein